MATARPRRGRRTPANPAVAALRWTWAAVLSLLSVVAGLALVAFGVLFAVVGAQEVLDPEDAGHLVAGVLFVSGGLAAAVGGALLLWHRQGLVRRLSGRKPPSSGEGGGFYGGGFFGGGGDCGGGGGGDGGGC